MIPAAPNQEDKVICWYIDLTLQTFVQQYESAVSPPFLMFKNASHTPSVIVVVCSYKSSGSILN